MPCEAARVSSAGREAGRGQAVRPAAARPRGRVVVASTKRQGIGRAAELAGRPPAANDLLVVVSSKCWAPRIFVSDLVLFSSK